LRESQLLAACRNDRQFGPTARTLTCMATKTKLKTCVHCGHTFDPSDRWRDLANPGWFSAASNYCSHECCDQYHRDMSHCCSSHTKDKARREAARAAR
jgi:hypothetical protein